MGTILNTYPVFESNQVLTSSQLNQMVNYLDQQNRLTRAKLIGMGIVCGLELSYNPSTSTLTISKGTGITSEGYLINLGDCPTVKYRPYKLPENIIYGPFVNPVSQKMDIALHELITEDAEPGTEDKTLDTPVDFLDDKVVILFIETFDKDLKSCLGKSCDELGKDRILTVRKLLINKTDLNKVWSRTNTGKLDAVFADKFELPELNLPRALLDSGISDYVSLSDRYAKAISAVYDPVFNALSQTYTIYRPLLLDAYGENNPFVRAPITTLKSKWKEFIGNTSSPGIPFLGIQYLYDFMEDLILAYSEFKNTAFDLLSECCPDMSRFPRHLMLGEALAPKLDLCTRNEFRNEFVQAPVYNHQTELLQKTISLHNRIVLMLESFSLERINAASGTEMEIHITPSIEKSSTLSLRSIPWYYDLDVNSSYSPLGKLEDYWNLDVAKKCPQTSDGLVLSYQRQIPDQTAPDTKLATPLYYNLHQYGFFRIEGHIGKDLSDTADEVLEIRDTFNLPFNLLTIQLDGDPETDFSKKCNFNDIALQYAGSVAEIRCELDILIQYWRKDLTDIYGEEFAREFILKEEEFQEEIFKYAEALGQFNNALPETLDVFIQMDFISGFINPYKDAVENAVNIKNKLNLHLRQVIGSTNREYPVELYVTILQLYNEFFRLLDSFILKCWDRKLAVVYFYYSAMIEKLKILDNAVFANLFKKHPGLDHQAGVVPGGTFVLLKNGIDSETGLEKDQVIGDFMLPYSCCSNYECGELSGIDGLEIPQYDLPEYPRYHFDIYAFGKDILKGINSKNTTPVLAIDVVSQVYFDRSKVKEEEVVLGFVINGKPEFTKPVNKPGDPLPADISTHPDSIATSHGRAAIAYVGEIQHCIYQPNGDFVGFDSFQYVFALSKEIKGHSTMGEVTVFVNCCGESVSPAECYSISILECWGKEPVRKAIDIRGLNIPGAVDLNQFLLDDLRGTSGFSGDEAAHLNETGILEKLLSCLKIKVPVGTDPVNALLEYQKSSCGGSTPAKGFTSEQLACIGIENVKEMSINVFDIDPIGDLKSMTVQLSTVLNKNKGFKEEQINRLSDDLIKRILECANVQLGDRKPVDALRDYQKKVFRTI
jgi:hypothetical protein